MEQNRLKDLEQRCVQEELPYCQAACPLKVNVRGLCAALAKGNHKEARTILARAVPLPDILGRLCEHPCENVCIREEKGGSHRNRQAGTKLSRKKLPSPPSSSPPPERRKGHPLRRRPFLSGLCPRTGPEGVPGFSGVCLPRSGGASGGSYPEDLLPKSVLEESWNLLQRMGVVPIPRDELIFTPPPEGSCAYVGADDPELQHPFSEGEVDPLTRETPLKGVFAGGFPPGGKTLFPRGDRRGEGSCHLPGSPLSGGLPLFGKGKGTLPGDQALHPSP